MMKTAWIPDEGVEHWVDAALSGVARYVGVNKYAILSGDKRASIVRGRRLFSAMLRDQLDLSFPEIAYLLGQDHSGVFYSYRLTRLDSSEMEEALQLANAIPSNLCTAARVGVNLMRLARWRERYRDGGKTLSGLTCPKCLSTRLRPRRKSAGVFCIECNHEFVPEVA